MGTGICRWCGAEVERGKEEEHFNAKSGMKCSACSWWHEDINESGEVIGHYCRFAEVAKAKGKTFHCVKAACRAYGIEYK